MKAIVCELCGSNQLIKADGVFVCEFCGTKYTLDEARRLMVGNTVSVDGPVTVDGIAAIDNLLVRARRYEQDRQFDYAESYYNRVLDIDADCSEALAGIARLERYVEGDNFVVELTDNRGSLVNIWIDGERAGVVMGNKTRSYQLSYGKHEVGVALGTLAKCKKPEVIDIKRKVSYVMKVRPKGFSVQYELLKQQQY